ncbi:MAG: cyclic nucleotide-binding protein [Bacteroidetes bacterium]|jgi:CRP-like cAMP-binding protein|nr:cyclic nucleotide-binding protein [Bacteroidota bacterium]
MFPGLITHIKKYVDLSEADVQLLSKQVELLQVKKKEMLLQEGQVCRSQYFVEKGCLRLFYLNHKGVEQTTQFAIENWWLSDYMSYDLQAPAQFSIQAIERSEIVCLDLAAQDSLVRELPQLERYFRLILQRAYAATQVRFRIHYELSKEENYNQFVSSFPGFVQRIPQYMLASYLGLTPEYLSEIRKKHS